MLLKGGRTLSGISSADYDFALFETTLALSRAEAEAKNEASAKKFEEQAIELARSLDETHGPYWGRRADQLLIRSQPGAGAGTEILSRAADNLYLKKEFDQAVAAYDEAARQARAGGNADGAFELAYRAALVQEQRQKHAEAARRFRALAVALPSHKEAAAAHLRGAWNEAKEAARDAEAEQAYVTMLAEQIATWPQSESAAQARLWLGKWYAGRKEWERAIEALSGITRESFHFPAAVASIAPGWQEHIRTLAAAGKGTEDEAERAAAWLETAIVGTEKRLPEKWTATDRTAALEMAKILLDYRPDKYREAESILQTALDNANDAPAAWRAEVQSQLVLAIAGQTGRRDDALTMLSQIGQASPEQLLDLLSGLSAVISRSRKEVRPQIAGIQLQAADMLWPERSKLSKNAALALTRIRAEALAATGKRAEAMAAFTALAKENPDNAAIQEGYADILLFGDAGSVKQSLDQWRRILSRAKPRSELWFNAKYKVALAQFKLGDKKEAAAVLRYTLELPPGLANTVWQDKYQTLLRECER
jgi:tetratricopeptide (TPR) repeat protein